MSPPESLWRLLLQAGGSCQLCRHPWQQTLVAIECLCRLKLLQCVKLSFLLPFLRLADEPALPRTDIKLLFAGFLGFSSRVRPLPLALKPRSAFRSQMPFFFPSPILLFFFCPDGLRVSPYLLHSYTYSCSHRRRTTHLLYKQPRSGNHAIVTVSEGHCHCFLLDFRFIKVPHNRNMYVFSVHELT